MVKIIFIFNYKLELLYLYSKPHSNLDFILLNYFRGLINDTYKMDLILIYPPHLIALACIYVASMLKDKDNTSWFEQLRVDMNMVKFIINFVMNSLF